MIWFFLGGSSVPILVISNIGPGWPCYGDLGNLGFAVFRSSRGTASHPSKHSDNMYQPRKVSNIIVDQGKFVETPFDWGASFNNDWPKLWVGNLFQQSVDSVCHSSTCCSNKLIQAWGGQPDSTINRFRSCLPNLFQQWVDPSCEQTTSFNSVLPQHISTASSSNHIGMCTAQKLVS